ncbi:uncharacterized protein KY384_001061 [Bacidia gigantensis]|uniref:uncharacterized protein n=1 Tax=Bacidia gigantensis TaxID=2732470 RepID=UPI001D03FDAE|nr:uncharacterized protein KY384_001061 [Bacidia gigantensis]KAG8534217.1 hypothetical protein KY384_001061 [Bacidia gigantensis]
MSSRFAQNNARWRSNPMKSDTSLSESERSFVSAESENASQEDARPSSSTHHHAVPSDASSTSSSLQPTPVARHYITTSPTASRKAASTSTPATGSYFPLQTPPTGSEARSPHSKRAPASRSSHGIETRSGPPPALITQKSYNADLPWGRTNGNVDSALSQKELANTSRPTRREEVARPRSMDETASMARRSALGEDDEDSTIRINERNVQINRNRSKSAQDQQQEDLFLNLADDDWEAMSRAERRRSRGIVTTKSSRVSTSGRPSTSGGHFPSQQASTREMYPPLSPPSERAPTFSSLASLRADVSRDRPYAASAHPLDQRYRPRYSGFNASPSVPISQQEHGSLENHHGRRRSINTSLGKYHSSPLSQRPDSSRGEEDISRAGPDGSDSTVSTTAPSTVWDELDDLKARIRKIELTGNLPATANSAISNSYGERPVTALTNMTTISGTPKTHHTSASPDSSKIFESAATDLHPLLRSALAKAKASVDAALYKILEATASEALMLAAMTGGKTPRPSSASQASASAVDRRLRWKADSMCRSLTELCIALIEVVNGPEKREGNPLNGRNTIMSKVEQVPLSPHTNDDPELRASSRVMSRLEARRSSLRGITAPRSPSSPQSETSSFVRDRQLTVTKPHTTASNLGRRDEDNESNVSWRPLSRAATDAGSHRPSPHTRASREYTSQHPLPSLPHPSKSAQVSGSSRKPYFSSPSTKLTNSPASKVGNGRNSERSTPLIDSTRLAEARQRRLVSLGYSSPSIAPSPGRRVQEVGNGPA